MNSKIADVLTKLDIDANKERVGKVTVDSNERMLAITSDTGMFFNIILKSIRAKRVLEVGTSTGYSTLWFADAIKYNDPSNEDNNIITIEENPSKIKRARKNFEDADVNHIIEIREGKAGDLLRSMLKEYQNLTKKEKVEPFDFIFLDADKENCIDYFELTLPMLKVGGIIAADNILHPESCVPEMTRYAEYVKKKSNVQSVTVPIGNGEEVTIKIK
ncbi:MAG: O-methyltransferase [Thaumarchaeota archaeon]|nr:O-methyltransferase [Nitrososphaerota archaeon]